MEQIRSWILVRGEVHWHQLDESTQKWLKDGLTFELELLIIFEEFRNPGGKCYEKSERNIPKK